MTVVLWLVAVALSGASGFYLGVGRRARTLGAIAAQNEISDGLA